MTWAYHYPRIPHLLMLKPTPRILLGRRLFWTEKKDGSNIAIWMNNNQQLMISSRNQEFASQDLQTLVKSTEEYSKVLELLKENPQFIVYVEACLKGRSITGAELYDKNCLFVFDIYDRESKKFLPFVNTHQRCYHHNIPIVQIYAETRHRSMKDLLKFRNHVLKYCKDMELEGMVIKPRRPYITTKKFGFDLGYVQAKVKLDIPEPKKRKIVKGEPIYPPIPTNEILGAIDKAWQELGNYAFRDVRQAMPLIARLVSEECKNHLYSNPIKKLFTYYKEYLERLK